MHALASQGRLKDVNRDAMHEFQRTSCSRALPTVGSADGLADRTLSNAVDAYSDYVNCRRSTTENTSWLKDHHRDEMLSTSEGVPLRRLELLESELASLNHARRRLAVDDVGAGSSSSNATRYCTVTGPTTEGDVIQSADNHRKDDVVAGGGVGDLNVPPWISSSFRDVADLQRRQLCGGSVLSTTTTIATSCFQSLPLTSPSYPALDDAASSLTRFTDSRFHGGVDDDDSGSPSKWWGSPVVDAKTPTKTNAVESRHEEGSTSVFARTPGKRELPSSPVDSVVEHPSTSVKGNSRLDSHCVLGMLTLWCLFLFTLSTFQFFVVTY